MPTSGEITKKVTITFARLAVMFMFTLIMFQIATSLTDLVFINRYDETTVTKLKCTFQEVPFVTKDLVSNITGEVFVILTVESESIKISEYSSAFSSAEIRSVGLLKNQHTKDYFGVSRFSLNDGEDYVVTGKFGDFNTFGNVDVSSVLSVTEIHKPKLLEEFISENMFLFVSVAILSWVVFVACLLRLFGYLLQA